MGRKVHPIGFRIGTIQDWQAKWYADTHYPESLQEDLKLRQTIQSKYADAAISLVVIDRQAKDVSVTIHTARPGIVIGRGGQRVDELSSHLEKLIGKRVRLNIQEIRQPELDANLVAKVIAEQIQRRVSYRRAMKQAIFRTMQAGAKGIRVSCSGRLGDAEIARRQTMHEGQVPLHTLRADIDYGFTEAHTTLGRIGVKIWIYKGDILPEPKELEAAEIPAELAVSKAAEAEVPAAVEPEEELAAPIAAEAAPEEEPAKLEEAAAVETVQAVAEAKIEEKPAKPVTRRRKKTAAAAAEPEEKPEEVVAVEAAEAAAEVKAEEKPAKPVTRRRRKTVAVTEAEEKPEEPEVVETAAEAVEAKAEEKPAKTAKKRSKKAAKANETTAEAEASTLTKEEEKDVTT